VNHRTTGRTIDWQARAEASEFTDLEDTYDDNGGVAGAGFFWPQLDELDAYVGGWEEFRAELEEGAFLYDISASFRELSKGEPV
jgi:hypothetical protein